MLQVKICMPITVLLKQNWKLSTKITIANFKIEVNKAWLSFYKNKKLGLKLFIVQGFVKLCLVDALS